VPGPQVGDDEGGDERHGPQEHADLDDVDRLDRKGRIGRGRLRDLSGTSRDLVSCLSHTPTLGSRRAISGQVPTAYRQSPIVSGMSSTSPPTANPRVQHQSSWVDGLVEISPRGSTLGREVRGGIVTFFTMAYIIVLNPLILGFAPDMNGDFLGGGPGDGSNLPAIAAGTALVAGVMSILMGVVANYPLALAAG